ncbi:MAG TPA: hypothetical protein VF411_09515 [Bacteroidia bacterium]
MSSKKKTTATSAKKIASYIPTTRGVRRPWAANLKTQLTVDGPLLGLSATETTDLQAALTTYTNAENDVDAAELVVKNKRAAAATAKTAMVDLVQPDVALMKKSGAYTNALGETMGIEGATHVTHFQTYKPAFRKAGTIFIENNLVHVKFIKGAAESVNVYARLKGAADWTLIGSKIKYSPFIDNRMLAVAGAAENRDYKIHGVYGDHEVGLDSTILTIAYGGGTIGSTTGGIIGGNTPPVTG